MNAGLRQIQEYRQTLMDVNLQPGIGIKPLLSLKRHYRVSVVVWVLVIVLGLPLVWIKGQSSYTAEAVFQVAPRYMKNLESDIEVEMQSNSQYREYVNHLSNTVTRYDVLERALKILREKGVDPKPPALTDRKYIERLQKTVYVRAVLDTYMVRIGTQGGPDEKAHLHELINAVMASFLETTKGEQIYGSAERLNVLNDSAGKLRAEVAALQAERVKLGERIGLTTFTENADNPYDQLLANTREKLAQAEIDRTRAEAMHRAFVQQREIPADMGRSLLEMRLGDSGLQVLRTEITRRLEQLTQEVSGLAEKHPARAPAVAEIKALTQRLQAREAEFDKQAYENFRLRLVATLSQKQDIEFEIRKTLTQLEGQSAEYARMFQQAIHLTKEIRDREDRLKQIQSRLNYLETERNALGFVRLVTPALPAEMPMGLGKTKLLLALIIAASGLALALPIAIDMLDRRIRSVSDAEKLMGIPAAGWQIHKEDLPTRIFAEDQTRRFVSALLRIRGRSQRRIFAFTSVKSTGGTTSTILDSAAGLANLGTHVLVVEANAFAPYAPFDGLQPGLTDYLAGKAELAALPHAFVHNGQQFSVVAIGAERNSGLQRLDLLQQACAAWAQDFDYVLFDLPPVLLSADAEMLIEALGQVFLVVEGEAVTRGEVSRAKRLLQKIDPEAVGLFVNNLPLFHGGGYMQELIVETLTRGKFSRFMTSAEAKLQWELLRTRWSLWLAARKATRGAKAKAPGVPPATPAAPVAPAVLAPEDIIALNKEGLSAARAGRLDEAAQRLCQVADLVPTLQFTLNAVKAIYALLDHQGWNGELAARADAFLNQAAHLDAASPEVAAARQQRAAVREKYRITDAD